MSKLITKQQHWSTIIKDWRVSCSAQNYDHTYMGAEIREVCVCRNYRLSGLI